MKKLLLSTALLAVLGFHAPAAKAQTAANCGVNYVPTIGVNCANVRAPTFIGQILGLVPAASASDVWCIDASATKSIHIRRVELSGTAGTAVTLPVVLIRRNTLDTGGTSATPNITKAITSNATSTATVISYTANPTITDSTSHQTIRSSELTLPVTSAGNADRVTWVFGTAVDAYDQGADLLKGSTQQFCINLGAVSVSSGLLNGIVEWTED